MSNREKEVIRLSPSVLPGQSRADGPVSWNKLIMKFDVTTLQYCLIKRSSQHYLYLSQGVSTLPWPQIPPHRGWGDGF